MTAIVGEVVFERFVITKKFLFEIYLIVYA